MTIRVNLLPHREMRRQRQQKQFIGLLVGVVLAAGALAFIVHTTLASRFENHVERNKYLEGEIAKLDKEIADIKKLKEMTAALLARKKVVETLQMNRADVVHLMDELARQLPEGIYLRTVKQTGTRVQVTGVTQSQARVSTLMRSLEHSPHLENANLVEIKASPAGPSRINEFTLNISLERPKEEAEKGAKPAAKPPAGK